MGLPVLQVNCCVRCAAEGSTAIPLCEVQCGWGVWMIISLADKRFTLGVAYAVQIKESRAAPVQTSKNPRGRGSGLGRTRGQLSFARS